MLQIINTKEINDKVFAVLGLGQIGGRVAKIAYGFGADVRYWSRNQKEVFEKKGINYQNLDDLIREADFVSINLAENALTRGIVTAERIRSLKPGAIVVNTAPMDLVDLDALKTRLTHGDITFIFDHPNEMIKEDVDALMKFKNCITYPPFAYATKEALLNKQKTFINNVKNFLNGAPTNIVNE